jgi:NADP-dependent 3-hydroxy acid dehydrogenase YdfG
MAETFRQQVVLITGASDGIGRELALQLAGEGAWLALASRNREKLEQVAQECQARGGRALAVPTDVGAASACRNLIDTVQGEYGQLHMLINNAGISMYARFADNTDLGMLEQILRVNFLGTLYCTSYALPALRQTQGRIVAVSSLAARITAPGGTAYAASKAALGSFFAALRDSGPGVRSTDRPNHSRPSLHDYPGCWRRPTPSPGSITRTSGRSTRSASTRAFSPDGRSLVSGSHDNTLKFWDAEPRPEILALKGHSQAVTSVGCSPDGKRLVSGSWEGSVKV